MRNFISVNDVANIDQLVSKALEYKKNAFADSSLGVHKKIGLLFFNPSLRTRISTQIAAQNLGMESIVFNLDKEGWALEFGEGAIMNGTTVEHIKDAAPILGSYFDILCVRSFPSLTNREDDYSEKVINAFIKYSGVSVVSLESATLHPLQSLTDIITITEALKNISLKEKPKVVLMWAPHVKALPQCVANSFAQWVNAWGKTEFIIACPAGYELSNEFTKGAAIINEQDAALKDADFVYVKNWSSYINYGAMPEVKDDWVLTSEKLKISNNAKIMHCLPVRRNVELSDELLDSETSLVTMQGANRVWAAQAVLSEILNSY